MHLLLAVFRRAFFHLDQMPAIARLHRLGEFARGQGKGRFLKGRDHPTATEKTEVAALGGRAFVVGDHRGQLGEILPGLDFLAQAADLLFELQRIRSTGHLGKVRVLQLYLLGVLVVGCVLLVVSRQLFVCDLNLVIGI